MKALVTKWSVLTSMVLLLYIFTSCVKSEVENETIEQIPYSEPCLKWNTDMLDVMSYMSKFNLINKETDYLYYTGRKIENCISYQFSDNGLNTVILTISNSAASLADLKQSLNEYKYIGETDSVSLFVKEENNTMATITTFTKGSNSYYAIGWSQIK